MNDIKNSSQDKINAFSPIEEGENKPKQVLELPVIDKNLPPVIREIVSNAPANRKLPAFIASLAPF
jgi:hypothetical protein